MKIPYFDAHCDTIYRCEETGEAASALEMGESAAQQRAYYAACTCLRENNGHVDLKRMDTFSKSGQFFALYGDANYPPADGMMGLCRRLHERFLLEIRQNADLAVHCVSGADVDRAVKEGKTAALLSIEGADLLDCDPRRLDMAQQWGVRFLNPVWNRANILSGTNCADEKRGLSVKGIDFIHEMEKHNIYVDVSHLSDAGFWDLARIAKRPFIASHSNSRAILPHRRNLTDDQFRAIRDSGGVVGLNLYLHFTGTDGTMEELIGHVEHFLELSGEKTLCIGGDLDGCEILAGGMEGVQDIPKLYEALVQRGYGAELLEDIFWNNLRRIL